MELYERSIAMNKNYDDSPLSLMNRLVVVAVLANSQVHTEHLKNKTRDNADKY